MCFTGAADPANKNPFASSGWTQDQFNQWQIQRRMERNQHWRDVGMPQNVMNPEAGYATGTNLNPVFQSQIPSAVPVGAGNLGGGGGGGGFAPVHGTVVAGR